MKSLYESILDVDFDVQADEKASLHVELKKLEEKLYDDYFNKLDPICKKYNAKFISSRQDSECGYDRIYLEVAGTETFKVKYLIFKVYKEIVTKYRPKFQKLLPNNKHNVLACVDSMITALLYNPYDKVISPRLSKVRILDMDSKYEVDVTSGNENYYIEVLTLCDIKNTGV